MLGFSGHRYAAIQQHIDDVPCTYVEDSRRVC